MSDAAAMKTVTVPGDNARWGSTSSVPEVAAALRGAKNIGGGVVVTTHAKPDGDAIGSVLAVTRALQHAGVDARIWLIGPIPRWAREIMGATPFVEIGPGAPAPAVHPALCLIVDTGTWSQLADLRGFLTGRAASCIVMDHHRHGDPEIAERRVVEVECASATQVVAPLCCEVLGVHAPSRLPVEVAEPLYLGMATDTGWFRFKSVTPAVLRLAADLREAGVDHTKLYRLIEQQDVPARWRLLGRALESLQLFDGDSVAIMRLTLRDFADAGAERGDTGGYADMVLSVATVRVACLLTEQDAQPDGSPLVKLSLRAKPGAGEIDVNAVCNTMGGGGHTLAAGAKHAGSLDDAERAILAALRAAMKR